MTRTLTCLVAAGLALTAGLSAWGQEQSKEKARNQAEVRSQYHAAQAALFSALAHSAALEILAETDQAEMDLARTYVHTINRDIQACDGDAVKVSQANHAAEKEESMQQLRKELTEAMKAIDEAQNAVDGHGALAPHAKNTTAHLLHAMTWLIKLAKPLGVKPLPAPGVQAIRDARG